MPAIEIDRNVDIDYITVVEVASMCFGERYVRRGN